MALVVVPRAGSAGVVATLAKWGATLSNLLGVGRYAMSFDLGTSLNAATPLDTNQSVWYLRTSNCSEVNVPPSGWRLLSSFMHAETNTGAPFVGSLELDIQTAPTTAGPWTSQYVRVIAGAPDVGGYWASHAIECAAGTALRVVARVVGAALPTTTPIFLTLNLEDLN